MANSFASEFDVDVREDLIDAGLAESGTYTAPAGAPVACTVIVDYDIAKLGDIGAVNDRIAIVTLFKDQIERPVPRAVVVVGSMSYTLDSRSSEDDSRSVWIARYGN